MAFQIINFCFCLWLVLLLVPGLALYKRKERGPFILLLFITVMLIVGDATGAAYTRASAVIPKVRAYNLNAATTFFVYVHVAFLPAVVLWFIHNRGMILCDSAGKLLEPFTSKKRKRIFDWVHVGSTFTLLISLIAITTHNSIGYELKRISLERYNTNLKLAKNISHACAALVISLYINVIASVILLNRRIKSIKGSDEVCSL
jgi:hypothetical protein